MIEGPVARPVARAVADNVELADGELRALAFMIAMIGAGLLSALFSTRSALGLAVGARWGISACALSAGSSRQLKANAPKRHTVKA
jgi:hypothetical protein